MKQLFFPVAIIVALIAFFVVIDRKEFNRYDDVQTVQSDIPSTNEKLSASVPQMLPMTEVEASVESKKAFEADSIMMKSAESRSVPESNSAAKPEAPVEVFSLEAKAIADANFLPTAVPVLTAEEAVKANEEAIGLQRDRELAKTNRKKTVAQVDTRPAAIPVLTPEEAIKANKEAIRYQQDLAAKERIHKIVYSLQSFFKKYSILFILALIVFVSELFFGTDPNSKNKSPNKEKVVQYAVPATLLLFNITVFIPWSVFLGNASNFSFVLSDFFYKNLAIFFLSTIALVLILFFIPSRIRGILTSLIAGLGLCFYFQSMFMNEYIGIMNGLEPQWGQHRLWGIINLIIWGVVVLSPVIIRLRFPSHMRTVTLLTAAVLGLEFIAILSQVCSASKKVWYHKHESFCDASNQFQLSNERNILVFIFDALSSDFTRLCFITDPFLKNEMKDFTWYIDALSNYHLTFFALPHEMTGCMIHPTSNQEMLFNDLWNSASAKSFYRQIQKEGYDSRMYVNSESCTGTYDIFEDYFSNIGEAGTTTYTVNNRKLFHCFVQISGYSSVPYFFKKYFFYGDDFSSDVVQKQVYTDSAKPVIPAENTNDRLYRKMIAEGITTNADSPVLWFHYTRGAHRPWRVDEKCNYHEEVIESFMPPTKSCYFFIAELIRLLKEKNIYDQTAILICSDHGHYSVTGCETDMFAMTFMVKPFFANNKEIIMDYSKVQSIDIVPTLLQLARDSKADFTDFEGFPPSNIPGNRQRKEYFGKRDTDFDTFIGVDGTHFFYNCFDEFLVDSDNSRNKVLQRTFPIKRNPQTEN